MPNDDAPPRGIDYDLAPTLVVDEPAQLQAVAHPLRGEILALLSERAATTKQLADVLERAPGTVGHHLKVLADTGLVRVVRTAKVRALTEKYYGRTAATFLLVDPEADDDDARAVAWAREWTDRFVAELRVDPEAGLVPRSTVRYARIPADRVEEWNDRLAELGAEFATQPADGDVVWGFALQLYPTSRRHLPPPEQP